MPTGRFTLAVNGTGFQTGSVVHVNRTATTTTFGSSSNLTATGSISTAGNTIPVTVVNPDGQVSNVTTIAVTTSTVTPISVSITPRTVTVRLGRTVQFRANVSGTSNKSVMWKVNEILGGNTTVGTITETGLYTTPAVVSSGPISVSATSLADPTRTASVLIQISQF